MGRKTAVVSAFLVAVLASAQRAQVVEVAAEPLHKTVLENEFVRVFRVEVPPGESSLMHRHERDYFWIAVRGAEIETTAEGARPERQRVTDGEKQISKAPLIHRFANEGNVPFLVIAVELKRGFNERAIRCGLGGRSCEAEVGDLREPQYSVATLFETDRMKVAETLLEPEAVVPTHEHPAPHLVVALTDLEIESAPAEGEPNIIRQQAADVAWVPAGVRHKLTNVGKQTAKFVSIEFR